MKNLQPVLAITSGGSGGTGKSTVADGLAQAATRRGLVPLVVDLDASDTNLTHCILRLDPDYGIGDIFSLTPIEDVMIDMVEYPALNRGYCLLPGDADTPGAMETLLKSKNGFLGLRNLLNRINWQHGPVILDCPPNYGAATKLALWAADYAIIPGDPTEKGTLGVLNTTVQIMQEIASVREARALKPELPELKIKIAGSIMVKDTIRSDNDRMWHQTFLEKCPNILARIPNTTGTRQERIFTAGFNQAWANLEGGILNAQAA